jgi:hypothetical protein
MELSIVIPSRSEMFLKNTIEDILANIEADTEVIALLDSKWAEPPIPQHERVNVIYVPEAIGQRAGTNLAVKLSKAKYVMKVDAHCSFDKGFDRKMIEGFQKVGDDVTMVPIMRNLWAFDWKCYHCGWKKYQGPTPVKCESCGKTDKIRRKMIWKGKESPQSKSYCFDSEPHFKYFGDYTHRPEYKKDLETGFTETMSLQGSCFMMTRERYKEFSVGREELGSWGSEGIEIACKTWLSGGRVLVNHNSWYAHLFRTQGKDFGFPYPQSGNEVARTKQKVKGLFFENKWPNQIYSLSWLVEKFLPVPGWGEKELAGIKRFDLPSHLGTFITSPPTGDGVGDGQLMPSFAENLSGIDSGGGIATQDISSRKNQEKMGGITTVGDITEVVKNLNVLPPTERNGFNEPSIHKAVDIDCLVSKTGKSMSTIIDASSPQPAPSFVEINVSENLGGLIGADIGNDK